MAAKAGIQVGDRIVSVNGERTPTWDDLMLAVLPKANRELRIEVERNGQRARGAMIVPASVGKYEVGSLGILPAIRPQVARGACRPAGGSAPASSAVTCCSAMDGQRGLDRAALIAHIQKHGDERRSWSTSSATAKLRQITVTPEGAAGASKVGLTISAYEVDAIDPTLPQAFRMSLHAELGQHAADRQDAEGSVHARDAGQAADGAAGDRRAVGQRGAARLARAARADGDDQPAIWRCST